MSNNQKVVSMSQIEELFIEVSKMFKEKQYSIANKSLQQLIILIEHQIASHSCGNNEKNMKKTLSECYLNKAICMSCLEEGDIQIVQCLQKALTWNHLNYWAYFNLYSLYFQSFNYRQALNNIKCALSCLYLTKAVLSKDLQSKSSQKDLGKALGLCSNNIEAKYVKLIMLINQNRWKLAINEIASLQELLGQNDTLQTLFQTIKPCETSFQSDEGLIRYVIDQSIKLVLKLKQQIPSQRLTASSELQQQEELIKYLNDKLYEYNQLMRQVNELGYVFGVFNFGPIATHDYSHRKVVMMANIISPNTQKVKEKQMKNKQQANKISIDYSARLFEGLNSMQNNSVNNQSLFDYTKSNNYMQASKGQFIGNLLSSMLPIQGGQSKQNQDVSQTNSNTFNIEGLIVGNMNKKGAEIKVIESQIHPYDDEEPSFPPQKSSSPNSKIKRGGYYDDDDEQFLLDSAFNKSYATNKKSVYSSRQQSDILNESKRSKLAQKKIRIYPVNEPYKFLEIFLNEIQFRDSKQKLIDLYCDIEIKCTTTRTYKFTSKRQNAKVAGVKSKVEWIQSLGFVGIPEEAATLEVRLMRSEKDKFFDSCLGKGQIEMTSAGLNKFPIYNGTKILAMTKCLSSSFKQSNLSSSYKTNSMASLRLSGGN